MADINLSPYTADQQAMNRRRRMAEAMQQESIAPIQMPTMPGVAISPYAGLAKILQGYIAGKNLSKADKEEKDYENQVSEDTARLLRNVGKTETIPGDIITPGKEAIYEPSVPIQENLDRKQELIDLYAPDPTNAARAAIGYNLVRPEDRERITNLPGMTEGREIPAVPEVRGASRQVPYLSADLLDPNNPLAMKTGQGRQMLAQYLMQQQAQQQAAAQAELAASRQLQAFNPEQNVGTFSGGKFNTIIQGQPKPMTDTQRLDAELKQFAAEVEADKALDVGRPARTFERLPKGVPIGAKKVGKDKATGKDVYKLNNELFVGE
jgi:hypothetical protein